MARHEDQLFYYLLFLRITPFLPNWFINVAAPHLDIDLATFYWGTFFGTYAAPPWPTLSSCCACVGVCAPSFLHVQAGAALDQLASDTFTLATVPNVVFLAVVALLAIVPPALAKAARPAAPPCDVNKTQ